MQRLFEVRGRMRADRDQRRCRDDLIRRQVRSTCPDRHREGAAAALLTGDARGAAVQVDERLDEREPDARAFMGA